MNRAASPGVATTGKAAVHRIHPTSHSASAFGADARRSRLPATESLQRFFRREGRPDPVRIRSGSWTVS